MASSPSPSVVPPHGSGEEDYVGLSGMVTLSVKHFSALNFLVVQRKGDPPLCHRACLVDMSKLLVWRLTSPSLFSLNASIRLSCVRILHKVGKKMRLLIGAADKS